LTKSLAKMPGIVCVVALFGTAHAPQVTFEASVSRRLRHPQKGINCKCGLRFELQVLATGSMQFDTYSTQPIPTQTILTQSDPIGSPADLSNCLLRGFSPFVGLIFNGR